MNDILGLLKRLHTEAFGTPRGDDFTHPENLETEATEAIALLERAEIVEGWGTTKEAPGFWPAGIPDAGPPKGWRPAVLIVLEAGSHEDDPPTECPVCDGSGKIGQMGTATTAIWSPTMSDADRLRRAIINASRQANASDMEGAQQVARAIVEEFGLARDDLDPPDEPYVYLTAEEVLAHAILDVAEADEEQTGAA